jgi:hypothetical protein
MTSDEDVQGGGGCMVVLNGDCIYAPIPWVVSFSPSSQEAAVLGKNKDNDNVDDEVQLRLDSSSAPLSLPRSREFAPHPQGQKGSSSPSSAPTNMHYKMAKRMHVEQSGTRTLERVNRAQVLWQQS